MLELKQGEVLEVITLDKSLEDDDYNEWLSKQKVHSFTKDGDDLNTYYDKQRRLLNVVSRKRSLIHYFGCVEIKKNMKDLNRPVFKKTT